MGQNAELYAKITLLAEEDRRYRKEAYLFVLAALEYTVDRIREVRHLTGEELSRGIADYARIQYGYMAQNVLEYWGLKRTHDFGEVVFNLIEKGLLRKSEEDKKEDFDRVFDFSAEFTWEKLRSSNFPGRSE